VSTIRHVPFTKIPYSTTGQKAINTKICFFFNSTSTNFYSSIRV